MSEFNLSEKIRCIANLDLESKGFIYFEDVKEFIRLLKEIIKRKKVMMGDNQVSSWYAKEKLQEIKNEIDKLAGSKLSGEKLCQ